MYREDDWEDIPRIVSRRWGAALVYVLKSIYSHLSVGRTSQESRDESIVLVCQEFKMSGEGLWYVHTLPGR